MVQITREQYARAQEAARQAALDAYSAWLASIRVSVENWVRPFVSIESFRTPRVPLAPPPVEPEAFIRFGGQSHFTFNDTFREVAGGGTIIKPDDDPDGDKEVVYSETGRSTHDKRVENPDDPDQFVVVKVIDSMKFNGPGARKISFQFSNPD